MYFNNLKKLRNEKELTQKFVANWLNVKRSTYNSWERGDVMIPIEIIDKLSNFYMVKLSYILGLDKELITINKFKPLNYDTLLKNINKFKTLNNNTYKELSNYLKCSRSSCFRYFSGFTVLPIDRLILLSKLYKIDIDKLCGKE